ncbi:metal-sensitive transcriptional regulator [Ferroacidibacillus organovorans]|uniref:Cytoplasmic protein n=1 Tax=Ferroacidibacillus organovorans TaxID=1765683 RepID=A0A101XQ94_9BACL|nr:metal-sensitive transcriptional regulator [Ferroacidibacillus organovorans]KUO95516.1 cytoplasmic protein [Ferroacidibacillus organovorans]
MEYTDKMFNRLKRVEGQIRGVLEMMEKERDCKDVVTQLSAIRSAVDKAIAAIVVDNLEKCIRKEMEDEITTHDAVQQAMNLLLKSR